MGDFEDDFNEEFDVWIVSFGLGLGGGDFFGSSRGNGGCICFRFVKVILCFRC